MTMTLVWLFCAFALMVGGILGFDHTDWRFVTTSYKGEKVNGVVGLNRRSMLMIPDPVDKASKCNRRTINQHDFEKRLVAMKDPVTRECLVKPLGKKETYAYTKKALDSGSEFVQTLEHWDVPKNPLAKDKVKRKIGSFLDDFCSDSNVFLLKSLKRAKKVVKRSWCVLCLWCQNKG
ncbi:uncharacterized protein LOC121385778 [Gigantopelta aegis]|uniref:uncharacterized protein LOC121385778 n=1 Tax=Gigantopelta aegis TaxID=1735272 RepID=UPI001B88E18F|nr:uncharacterized protein LOC121385778 [Gigantopelta aegis]XP_041372492.1 uncharacterized protein LOC121385778 [Gigantopelta aegis]